MSIHIDKFLTWGDRDSDIDSESDSEIETNKNIDSHMEPVDYQGSLSEPGGFLQRGYF